MSNERRGFELAIAASPSDAAAHGAFADWLDDHDEPVAAAFHRAVGQYLDRRRTLPGRFGHLLPSGQTFTDAVFAEDDRFVVGRNRDAGTALVVMDFNDIVRGRGLARRHAGYVTVPVIVLSLEHDQLPPGVDVHRLAGSPAAAAVFEDTLGGTWKIFADHNDLLRAMEQAFA